MLASLGIMGAQLRTPQHYIVLRGLRGAPIMPRNISISSPSECNFIYFLFLGNLFCSRVEVCFASLD